MRELAVADRVEVLILVDNVTDNLSSNPDFVENEFLRFWKEVLTRQAFDRLIGLRGQRDGLTSRLAAREGSRRSVSVATAGPPASSIALSRRQRCRS